MRLRKRYQLAKARVRALLLGSGADLSGLRAREDEGAETFA